MASDAFEEIVESFEFLEDWEDRYRYVIELGKKFSEMESSQQIPATKVGGCASQVWIAPEVRGQGPEAVIDFTGTSDALIVRGLIGVLHALYGGQKAADVLKIDAISQLARLGLNQHLSAQRTNGLRSMVGRIREIAELAISAGEVKEAG